jgi:hypothetical protein
MKKRKLLFIFLILAFVMIACSKAVVHDDPFYNNIGAWDSDRIPLIKPYYLAYLEKETGWQMPLLSDVPSGDMYYYYNIHGIEKVSVVDGLIMIYTPYIEKNINVDNGDKIYHWFVISPVRGSLEIGFESEDKFLSFIKDFGIQEVSWKNPDELYKTFYKTRCLDWIPDCQ